MRAAQTLAAVLGCALIALLGLSSHIVHSQQATDPKSVVLACAYNTTPPTVAPGNFVFVQCNNNGTLLGSAVVTVAPYAYTPLSPGQHNLAIVSATALTIPTGSTYATVCAATANAKYTTDGTTTPTSSVGMTLANGACVTLSGATVLANFKAISSTGTLDVEYFR